MAVFLNELSLHGQYKSSSAFSHALALIFRMKEEIEKAGDQFLCCDQLRLAPVTVETSFQTEISSLLSSAQRLAIVRWFDKSNWIATQVHNSDDEFFWQDIEVTNSSMAEAAFRLQMGERSVLFGFAPSQFNVSPLSVSWETATSDAELIKVGYHWSLDELIFTLQSWSSDARGVPIQTWRQLIDWGKKYCYNLVFPDYVLEHLKGIPFSSVVAAQVKKRFEVLNTLKIETSDSGERTAAGHQLYQKHFVGERAWFTDESDTNKQKFNKDMTFPDPLRNGEKIFCPWHGKISTLCFRIHFTWPLNHPSDLISIVYVGPKITKN